MSPHTWLRCLSIGSRCRLLAAFAVTLSTLLSLAAPRVHAQDWDGSVEVSTGSLEVPVGGAVSYRVRLSKPPTQDGWWIILRVDGDMRADGEYAGIRWVPSVGWEFNRDNWDQWREITVYGEVDEDRTITFEHEVWDHESNCPFKGSPLTVQVSDNTDPNPQLPALTIAGAEVEEGGTAQFQVTLTGTRTGSVTVDYATVGGTAQQGSDYTHTSRSLTFAANESSKTISVPTVEDDIQEQTESFTVNLSNPSGATIQDGTATGTINDDDDDGGGNTPTLSIADAAASEGDPVVFTVTLTGARTGSVTVSYATVGGTAQQGSDYTHTSRSLTFAANESSKTISVPTVEDDIQEQTESFTVNLSNPSGATIQDGTATGTINDDDDDDGGGNTPTLSIADAAASEGDPVVFTVTLTGARTGSATVSYATVGGTAQQGSDYTHTSRSLTFAANESSKTISVPTVEDDIQEQTESFTVNLSNPSGATIQDGTATGTINDDDDDDGGGNTPTLSIADAAASEGDPVVFTVTLTGARTGSATVSYATVGGTAQQGSDYTHTSRSLTFAANESSKTISVPTVEDDIQEQTETFTVNLSNPSGATIQDGTATGTINDDDDDDGGGNTPTLSIADAAASEGDPVVFTVTLTGARTGSVTVSYATVGGTAQQGSDYTHTSRSLTFAANESSKTISVPTVEDDIQEQTETFTVNLSNPSGATIQDGTATGTITDDDDGGGGDTPTLSIADAQASEGDPVVFTVTLTGTRTGSVTVDYATTAGTASQGSDYTHTSESLTFATNESSKTISVPTVEDDIQEQTESFTVNLSNPSGATIQDGTATGTITDDDDGGGGDTPTLSIADAQASEGDPVVFTVTLTGTRTGSVTVDYATTAGTASQGSDYTHTSESLTFATNESSKTISVPTVEDTTEEQTETFTVTLSNPSGASIQDGTATGTITDDDGGGDTPTLSIANAAASEGDPVVFTVTLTGTRTGSVTVDYATTAGTARQGSDYAAASGTLQFAPGEASKTIPVPTVEDTVEEQTETFTVTLSNPGGATIQDGTATGTITDDEPVTPLPTVTITDTEVKEGDMAEFLVTLRPASDRTATVSFRTVDGTAAAGFDYTSTMGTLRYEPGETSATIAVSTLTDEIADGAERFTLELSDPVGATVADGIGVGTITDDHTARIGTVNRTILPEVGRALAFNAVTCRFDRPLSQPIAGNGRRRSAGHLSLSRALIADRRTSPASPWTSPAGQGMSPADPWTSPAGRALTLEQALGDSSFLMPSTTEQGGMGRYTAWGCADYRHLGSSGNGPLSWNGVAFSAQIGADIQLGSNTLAGVSVSRSRSSFDYFGGGGDGDRGGANQLRLTGVNPYVAWSVTPDLDVWGTIGHAWGDLRVDDNLGAGSLRSAATLNSGTVGINGRLLARGGTMLRLRGEGGLAHLGVAGDGGTLGAVGLDMRRVRLSTEASYEHLFSFGSTLTPWGELGLRHDGGDGESGAGLEVRAGLRYRHLPQGLTIEGYGRRLVVHEGAVRESGFGAVLRVDPGESGLGPSMSVTPAWGATASGVNQLWERGASGFSMLDAPGTRMNAHFAYGLPALNGGGLLTPFGALILAGEQERGYGLGATLAVGRSATFSLEAARRRRLAGRAIYAVMLRGMLQF